MFGGEMRPTGVLALGVALGRRNRRQWAAWWARTLWRTVRWQ